MILTQNKPPTKSENVIFFAKSLLLVPAISAIVFSMFYIALLYPESDFALTRVRFFWLTFPIREVFLICFIVISGLYLYALLLTIQKLKNVKHLFLYGQKTNGFITQITTFPFPLWKKEKTGYYCYYVFKNNDRILKSEKILILKKTIKKHSLDFKEGMPVSVIYNQHNASQNAAFIGDINNYKWITQTKGWFKWQ